MNNREILLKNYINNLKVEVQYAAFTKVWPEWKDIGYVPGYSKLYFICDGEGWLNIDGHDYYPKAGQLFLMPQGVKQSYSTTGNNTFLKYWCHFTASVGDTSLFDVIRLPYFINVKERAVLEELFQRLIKAYEGQGAASALRTKAIMLEIIAFYLENINEKDLKIGYSRMADKLNLVLEYIDKNLSSNITVEKLAQIVHLHPNYFIRVFRKELGTSPINYINQKRVEKVKLLLETNDDTLAVIAEKAGFGDIYYLSRMFKEYTGYSPSEYRKLIMK